MADTKNKGGRPKGSGHGQQIVARIRFELSKSLDLLEADGQPLADLLATQLKTDPAKTLNALGKFVPASLSVEHTGENLIGALEQIGAAIDDSIAQAKAGDLARLSGNKPDIQSGPEMAESQKKKLN